MTAVFSIDDKIIYNAVIRNRPLIEEYKIYYAQLNVLYEELEIAGSFRKNKLLRTIKTLYLKTVGDYIKNGADRIQAIRQHSDNIIEDIENKLLNLVQSNSCQYEDDITFAISIIMVDAFMRCKILEEPQK